MTGRHCKSCNQLKKESGCGDFWCSKRAKENDRFYRALDNFEQSGNKEAARFARKIRGLDW